MDIVEMPLFSDIVTVVGWLFGERCLMVCVWHVPNPCWFQFSCRSRRCPASCAPETSASLPTRRKGSPPPLFTRPALPLPLCRRSSLLIKQINMIILLLLMDIAIRLHLATNTAAAILLPLTMLLYYIYTATRLYWRWRDINIPYCLSVFVVRSQFGRVSL